jgi:hypothetical protein
MAYTSVTAMSPDHCVICIDNANYEAALETRKIYETIPDDEAARLGLTLVIAESGEDDLYPLCYFVPIDLPQKVERAMSGRT